MDPVRLARLRPAEDPRLALSRWRAADELAEFTQDALRFSLEEARALAEAERLPGLEERLPELMARTQGCPAGLRLCFAALRGKAGRVFTERAKASGLVPSMGSIGDCYDNGMMESFWSRMQVELLDRRRWRTRIELANAIFEYLEIFYNRQRRHSALGYLSPIQFENQSPVA